MQNRWLRAVVLPGNREGRTIGFPTANLDPDVMDVSMERGVYAALVRYGGKVYEGVLYYGPRLVKKEQHTVLEIHILDFSADIYGKTLRFRVGPYLRGIMDFASLEKLKKQIAIDVSQARIVLCHAKTGS